MLPRIGSALVGLQQYDEALRFFHRMRDLDGIRSATLYAEYGSALVALSRHNLKGYIEAMRRVAFQKEKLRFKEDTSILRRLLDRMLLETAISQNLIGLWKEAGEGI